MNICTSPAIIMKVKEFGESDLLVTFFTPDKGQQKGVAKGARRSRRRFVNCLDLFSLVNLEYRIKKEGDLCFLNSGKLLEGYLGLRSDFSTLTRASYFIELTQILFPCGVVAGEMFRLLKESLGRLAQGPERPHVHLIFEARAMSLAGYGIDLKKCCVCGRTYAGEGTAVFRREKGGIACLNCAKPSPLSPPLRPESIGSLEKMQAASIVEDGIFEFSDESVRELKAVLKLHREYHLGLRPKTACYLE